MSDHGSQGSTGSARLHEDGHWAAYNARQAKRPVRELLVRALELAGPDAGRTAIDLGCGAGVETRALLDAGWRVHAFDGDPTIEQHLTGHERLTVHTRRFDEITELPRAALVYSGYSLSHQPRNSFARLWPLIRAARPEVLAVNLFGDRDEWAADPNLTFLTEPEARELFTGLDIAHWHEEDEVAPAFGGPKHWHVFDVIATSHEPPTL